MSKLLDSLLTPTRLAECQAADAALSHTITTAAARAAYVREVREYAAAVRSCSLSQTAALERFNALQAKRPAIDPSGALFGALVSQQPAHEPTFVELHAHLEEVA